MKWDNYKDLPIFKQHTETEINTLVYISFWFFFFGCDLTSHLVAKFYRNSVEFWNSWQPFFLKSSIIILLQNKK